MNPGPYFTISELASATGGRFIGSPPPGIAGVSTDTRAISPDSAFLALRGERFDGHDFLAEAARGGAACAVVAADRAAAAPPGLPLLAVRDTLQALG
ncbi:MAG: Mur ligase domain-containing protein, partial [Deltaproteobacteria bacterium]|nr:Mur ligase domain-containing protein [Deltaproteobacteria bacterium]